MTVGELFTLLGFLTGAAVLWFEARRRGLNTEGMRMVGLSGLLGGVVGAKLTEWIVSGQFWSAPLAILDPRFGGKALLGGLAVGWLTVILVKRRLGIKRSTGDLWALALPAGEAVGRLGCFFNGCCYGLPCGQHFPLAVWLHDAWRYPTQIYSAITALALFVILFCFDRRCHREGDTWKLFVLLWCVSRFGLEFLRERPLVAYSLSAVQLFCVETIVLMAFLWYRTHRGAQNTDASLAIAREASH